VIVGTIVGLVAAAIMARVIESMVIGVSPFDLVSFGTAAGLMTACAAAAASQAATRARRVSPGWTPPHRVGSTRCPDAALASGEGEGARGTRSR
jgi:hypothetical protein